MASTAREIHYQRHGAVIGDLALEREERGRDLRRTSERRRETVRPRVRSISHVQVRERQKVSVAAIMGVTVVLVMAVAVLAGYVQLTEMSSKTTTLQNKLTTLETKNVSLNAEYEKMYDLTTVKEKAEAAGMAKPSNSQIHYVDLSGGDSAVVYTQKDQGFFDRLRSSLHNGIYAVVEYFD